MVTKPQAPKTGRRGRPRDERRWHTLLRVTLAVDFEADRAVHTLLFTAGLNATDTIMQALREYIVNHHLAVGDPALQARVVSESLGFNLTLPPVAAAQDRPVVSAGSSFTPVQRPVAAPAPQIHVETMVASHGVQGAFPSGAGAAPAQVQTKVTSTASVGRESLPEVAASLSALTPEALAVAPTNQGASLEAVEVPVQPRAPMKPPSPLMRRWANTGVKNE